MPASVIYLRLAGGLSRVGKEGNIGVFRAAPGSGPVASTPCGLLQAQFRGAGLSWGRRLRTRIKG